MPGRDDQRRYNVSYYRRQQAQEIDRVTSRQASTLRFLRDVRRTPCADCGGSFEPYQMDFDHRDPRKKAFQLTAAGALLKSRAMLVQEIQKCDIVCANCHAVRTYAMNLERTDIRERAGDWTERPRRARQRMREHAKRDFLLRLRDTVCTDCRMRHAPYVMEFDHRDPATKKFLVANSWGRSNASILSEAAKCDIVCRNCHRARTFHRRTAKSAGVTQW